ncbi:MAG: NADH-quinone oxidoreductase subunit NuoK [Candidatus Asgardarchaeia archaeon]
MPIDVFLQMFSFILFVVGVYGFLSRRNMIRMLISIEIMINAANLNLVFFAISNPYSHFIVLIAISLAAVEAAIGLSIIMLVYLKRTTIETDELKSLAG